MSDIDMVELLSAVMLGLDASKRPRGMVCW